MTAYTPEQIVHMAQQFTRAASQALSFLQLPSRTDGELFEALMDKVADDLPLHDAAWDLFAATARLQFFDNDAPKADRIRWSSLADDARAELYAAAGYDALDQAADYYADQRRDEQRGAA